MRIAFYQDLEVFSGLGGAQATDRLILHEGIRRGHEITQVLPETYQKCDAAMSILSNCTRFTSEQLADACKRPYIVFLHDYWPLCKYRLFYAMLPKCSNCPNKPYAEKLLIGSKLIVWMSPLHRTAWLNSIPNLADHSYALVSSAINPVDYRPKERVDMKHNTVVGVNVLLEFKGKTSVLKYSQEHPELSFTFCGGLEGEVILPQNCKFIGPKNRQELVQLYAESEYLIHLPSQPSPADRVPVEFLIANPNGKLVTNRNVGILSYPNVIQDGKVNREELIRLVSTAPQTFWKEVEKSASL